MGTKVQTGGNRVEASLPKPDTQFKAYLSNPFIGSFEVAVQKSTSGPSSSKSSPRKKKQEECSETFFFISNNRRFAHLCGHKTLSFEGMTLTQVLGEENAALLRAGLHKICRLKEPSIYEQAMEMPHSPVYWQIHVTPNMTPMGKVMSLTATVLDITSQRNAERALRVSQQKNTALLRTLPDTIIKFSKDGRFLEIEEGSDTDWMLPVTHCIGKSLEEVLPANVAEAIQQKMQKSAQTQQTCVLEYSLELGGKLRSYEMRLVALNSRENMAIVRDITERKDNEEELMIARDKAEEASRSKSAFLAAMSHELRTPLNAIIGFSDILRQEVFGKLGSKQYKGYATDIHDSGAHLLELIEDIIEFSKLHSGHHKIKEEIIDIGAHIRQSMRLFGVQIRDKELDVTLDLPVRLPSIYADQRAFRQMMMCVVSNAVKYTPRNGAVTVAARREVSGGVTLIVSDTGPGIPARRLESIFKPFNQRYSKIRRSGTGLGLPKAKSIVEMHQGTINIRSEKNNGTKVFVRFPTSRTIPYDPERLAQRRRRRDRLAHFSVGGAQVTEQLMQ